MLSKSTGNIVGSAIMWISIAQYTYEFFAWLRLRTKYDYITNRYPQDNFWEDKCTESSGIISTGMNNSVGSGSKAQV